MPEPTLTPPGPDKVEVLAARYEANEELWNPFDCISGDDDDLL